MWGAVCVKSTSVYMYKQSAPFTNAQRFLWVDADSQGCFMSTMKSSSGSWEQPRALPKLMVKTGTGETQS